MTKKWTATRSGIQPKKLASKRARQAKPTEAERAWLAAGLDQQAGRLPLFDAEGQRVDAKLIQACLDRGWCEPWFDASPHLLPFRITDAGMAALYGAAG